MTRSLSHHNGAMGTMEVTQQQVKTNRMTRDVKYSEWVLGRETNTQTQLKYDTVDGSWFREKGQRH